MRDTIAFDNRLSALAGLIGSVDRPGEYCVHARTFAPMPRIEVADVGVLSFPLPPAQLDALIAGSEPAPHGRGEDTLVDRSVRHCRQIAPGRIEIGGTMWSGTLGGILDRAAEGLGCPEGALGAEFYKLLIYEPGGFFAPHRDTEKADGMVATLTVGLPVADWHRQLNDPTVADAILDRLVHGAIRIELHGTSMRIDDASAGTKA